MVSLAFFKASFPLRPTRKCMPIASRVNVRFGSYAQVLAYSGSSALPLIATVEADIPHFAFVLISDIGNGGPAWQKSVMSGLTHC